LPNEELKARRAKAQNAYDKIQSLISQINKGEQPQSEENL